MDITSIIPVITIEAIVNKIFAIKSFANSRISSMSIIVLKFKNGCRLQI